MLATDRLLDVARRDATILREIRKPMEARIAHLESDVAHLRSDVGEMKVDLRALREKMDGLRDKVDERIIGLSDKFDGLKNDMVTLRGDVASDIASAKNWGLALSMTLTGLMLTVMARGFGWI